MSSKYRLLGRCLSVLLIAGLGSVSVSAREAAQLSSVEISFSAKVPSTLPVKGSLVLRPMDGAGEPLRLPVSSPTPISLELAPGSRWEVSADLPGFWVARKTLEVGTPDPGSRLVLDLWPLGEISGTLKVKEKDARLPKRLLVKTLAAPAILNRPAAPKGALDCPVDEKGAWKCSLPAAAFDLVISAEGLTPAYRWGVQVPAGKAVSLGTIELQRGASVAAWVVVEDGAIAREGCVARLTPLVAGGTSLESAADLRRTAVQREVRKDGFLQVTGLAPGTYVLEVEQPGYPPVRVSPVRVEPGAETFLRDPLILRKARNLAFEVSPPRDWLDRRWHARVFRTEDRAAPDPVVFDGAVDEEGRFAVAGQSTGSFRIDLLDSLGNRLFSSERQLGGADTGPEALEVDLVTVEGRLRLGEEPLAASLWFGGRSGATSIRMESDREGRFHGVLPRTGLWRMEVEAVEPALQTWTRAEVREDRSGKARLDVTLPDTRVFGRVVDEQGRPVARATVLLQGETMEQVQETGDKGAFDARALPEGSIWLGATSESEKSASGRTFVTLAKDRAVGPVELRLHPVERLIGTVSSARGPVVGARVMVLSRFPDGGGGVAATGLDGAFTVELPRVSPRVVAIVSAPGFPLRAFDTAVDGQRVSLPMREEGGNLEIGAPGSGEDFARDNLTLAILQNGVPIPLSVLTRWAYEHGQPRGAEGQSLRIPDVASGEYRVCILPGELAMALPWTSLPEGTPCDSGLLTPGGRLTLKPGRSR
jgi:hypothetical protein